jgi:hypothetical protein
MFGEEEEKQEGSSPIRFSFFPSPSPSLGPAT